jgi:hypothetical protein
MTCGSGSLAIKWTMACNVNDASQQTSVVENQIFSTRRAGDRLKPDPVNPILSVRLITTRHLTALHGAACETQNLVWIARF